jgi:hypothetical protein
LVAAALRAFLMLSASGEDVFDARKNKSTTFLDYLDLVALNQRERRRIRGLAGVVSATLSGKTHKRAVP